MSDIIKPCELPCPKCGSGDCIRVYVDIGGKVHNEDYCKCNNRWANGTGNYFTATREHIDHTCRTCTHRWQTPPLPKPKRAKT